MFELAVIMDPIEKINPATNSTFALLLEAQKRNWVIQYIEPHQVYIEDGVVFAAMKRLKVEDNSEYYFYFSDNEPIIKPLHTCDVTLLRKDPPFDINYLYLTYLLEHAEKNNHLVINKPQSVRDANEKMFASWFPQCCPPTLVSSQACIIKKFLNQHKKTICKPLDNMGGHLVFLAHETDPNINVVIETLTQAGQSPLMIQKFIPEIKTSGDKRVLMIDGLAYPHALSRIPKDDDIRGNLAAGGTGMGVNLTTKNKWICEQIGPTLKEKGLLFVGLDIIGDYLTEINVTSPMGIRQIDQLFNVNISAYILDAIVKKYHEN